MANGIIKKAAAEKHVRLWRIAEQLQMTDSMFSRHLRHELSENEQARILKIIYELAEEKEVD